MNSVTVKAISISNSAHDIIENIIDDYHDPEGIELSVIKNVLEDGEALASLGITDDDQDAVEQAWDVAGKLMGMGFVRYSECKHTLVIGAMKDAEEPAAQLKA